MAGSAIWPGHFYRGLPFLLRRHGTSPGHTIPLLPRISAYLLDVVPVVSRWLIVPATPAQVRRARRRGDPPCMHRRETMKSVDDTRANPRCTVLSVKPTWKRVIGLSCMQRARRSVSDGYTARWQADMIARGVSYPSLTNREERTFSTPMWEINKIFACYYLRIS